MGSSYPFGESLHSHGSRRNLASARESHLQELSRPPVRDYAPSIKSWHAQRDDYDAPADNTPDSRPDSPVGSISVNIRGATLLPPVPGSPPDTPDPTSPGQGRVAIFAGRSTSPDRGLHDIRTAHAHFADDTPTRPSSPASLRGRSQSRTSRPMTPSNLGVPSRGVSPSPSATPSTLGVPSRAGSPSPSVTALRSAHIFPCAPESFSRYQTRSIVKRTTPKPPGQDPTTQEPSTPDPLQLPPFTTDFMSRTPKHPRWKYIIHPEGQPYFVHQAHYFRVYTDANVFDDAIRKRVERDMHDIQKKVTDADMLTGGSRYDLALETYREEGKWNTAYYLADHAKKAIFYVDAFDLREINVIGGLEGVEDLRHIHFELTAQYWHHVQAYPTCRSFTMKDLCELRDEVMHNIGDTTTSPYSTSPYSYKELLAMLPLLTHLKENLDMPSPGCLTLVARAKTVFARSRFLHWHGLTCARLERTTSVYGDEKKTTWLIKTISPLLFSAPDVVHRLFQKIWTDEIVHRAVFEEAIGRLQAEWQDLILIATVLLASNVGFLAIGSVDGGGGNSATQIASYISTLTSSGSLTLGLLLSRQTKIKNRECAEQMQDFLKRKQHKVYGLEKLAILYSLPFALIMWSSIFFLASFALFVFIKGGIASRVISSFCMAAVVLFIVWCIGTGWEKQPPPEPRFEVPCGADATSIRSGSPSTSALPHSGHITPSDAHTGSKTMFIPEPNVVETPWGRFLSAFGLRRPVNSTPLFSLKQRRQSTLGEIVIEAPLDGDV